MAADRAIDITLEFRRAMKQLGCDPDQVLIVGTKGEKLARTLRQLGAPQDLLDIAASYGVEGDAGVLMRLKAWNSTGGQWTEY